jgi:hypothetical protein
MNEAKFGKLGCQEGRKLNFVFKYGILGYDAVYLGR